MSNEKKANILVEKQIEYLKYCHTKIEDLKSSIYQRASILIVVVGFLISNCSQIILSIINNISKSNSILRILIISLSAIFLCSFLSTLYWGIKCLIPLKSRNFLVNLLNQNRSNGKNNIPLRELSDLISINQDILLKEILDEKNIVSNNKVRVFTTFDHICDLRETDFEKMVKNLDSKNILEQYISSIYNLSHISKKRYIDLLKAYKCLLLSIIIFIVLIMTNIILKLI